MKKFNRLISLMTILGLTCGVGFTQTSRQPKAQSSMPQQAVTPAATSNPVTGSGTVGRIAKWTGVDGANSFSIGNTNIFEDKFGKVGIGTITPTSPLTVQGMIETTLGGYKFPDGTVQTTAGLSSIFHNATMVGNGTQASPLGVAIPLTLSGAEPDPSKAILTVVNTASVGRGLFVQGGPRGFAIAAVGGDNPKGDSGGVGIEAFGGAGGNSESGPAVQATGGVSNGNAPAGVGVIAMGGVNFTNGLAGVGVEATGGTSVGGGSNGAGVKATGGNSSSLGASKPGDGVVATGGDYLGENTVSGGSGVVATGGESTGNGMNTKGGIGVEATGGKSKIDGGAGIVATGGESILSMPGMGVQAFGGIRNFSDGRQTGAAGIFAAGSDARGAGTIAGDGLIANAGAASNGATKGRAAIFGGDVLVVGALNVTGMKNFKIDHPLDPANKYLYHAAIESSEILNVYSGNVKTNKKGEAIVTLPDWFQALNKDFRYQLTVVGRFAQAIVSEEIKDNRFTIKTSSPQVKVSWQVTGIRSDAGTRSQQFKVEEEKPVYERGTYLSPEAFGEPKEKGIKWARNPEPAGEKQPEVSKVKAQGRNR